MYIYTLYCIRVHLHIMYNIRSAVLFIARKARVYPVPTHRHNYCAATTFSRTRQWYDEKAIDVVCLQFAHLHIILSNDGQLVEWVRFGWWPRLMCMSDKACVCQCMYNRVCVHVSVNVCMCKYGGNLNSYGTGTKAVAAAVLPWEMVSDVIRHSAPVLWRHQSCSCASILKASTAATATTTVQNVRN